MEIQRSQEEVVIFSPMVSQFSAKTRVYLCKTNSGLTTAGKFDVFRVTGAWSEGTITHNPAPSLTSGAEVSGIAVAGAQRSSSWT
jgi:hypothetical protein